MKKIILTKTSAVVQTTADGRNTTLSDRKSMLGNYKKLFEALFDLPDKKVVARVFDAINKPDSNPSGIEVVVEVCSKCNQKTAKVTTVDASTQTEGTIVMQHSSTGNSDDSRDMTPIPSTAVKLLTDVEQTRVPVKRKRRRKMQIPQVIKKSQAQQLQQNNKPMLQKRKATVPKPKYDDDKKSSYISPNGKRQRHDSFSTLSSISDLYEGEIPDDIVTQDEIKNIMVDEWIKAESKDADGLYPIHSAIVKSESKLLERQIAVWKHLKHTDLNDILTDDEEDCLQLAIVERSSPEIVNILLSHGLNTECRDEKSNTIVHLAILNEASPNVLQLLMEKIDLKSLSELNYDGYTPLHLAVRQNEYILAETVLDTLDKRLLGDSHYKREKVPKEKNTEANFSKYYESCCERPKLEMYLHKYSKENLAKKRTLLDAGDICSGTTVLLYAIENKLEHFIYFLLAHLANPQTKSLSGQNPTSFMNEFAKCLNLSLRIDQVMENIVFLLNN